MRPTVILRLPAAAQASASSSLAEVPFDAIVDSNEPLYAAVRDRVQAVWDGYNASIVAFGPTGSGKTSSLAGGGMMSDGRQRCRDDWHQMGVLPRAISELRRRLRHDWMRYCDASNVPNPTPSDGCGQVVALLSCARMYLTATAIINGRCVDLLAAPPAVGTTALPRVTVDAFRPFGTLHQPGTLGSWTSQPLSKASTPGELLASGLTQLTMLSLDSVSDRSDDDDDDSRVAVNAVRCAMRDYLEQTTRMGCPYNRSTVVYTLYVERSFVTSTQHTTSLNFLRIVDLCGCETRNTAVDANLSDIPLSLLCVEKVTTYLAKGSKHVPFRASYLTMLLRDALLGSGLVTLICCQRACDDATDARSNSAALRLVQMWVSAARLQQVSPLRWPMVGADTGTGILSIP